MRTRAKIELGKRDRDQVITATKRWAANLDPKDPAYEHHLLEALWVHQWQDVVDETLLKRLLRSPDYHARAAATRVLCYSARPRLRTRWPCSRCKPPTNTDACAPSKPCAPAASSRTTRPPKWPSPRSIRNRSEWAEIIMSSTCLDETMKALDKYVK